MQNIVTPVSADMQSQNPALHTPAENTGMIADSHLGVCRKELDILKRVDNARYLSRKVLFDKLMSGARLYGDVRGDLQSGTRSTVDALFSYKLEKLCADISQDVLNSLSRIGENSNQ
ncbi:TPA: hypothetical protein R4A49_004338 [Salmonella enterica subsp. enterica serovar Muenchen]|nr:hypothetical protein [Salmonella enterica subsp. enterica serovar Muenchen]HEC8861209.1 hypothetical protein [Salmonella enterica subsp. enterica serovar Muenchen]